MNSISHYNLHRISWYFLLNSLAIGIAASGVITDMLLLKMGFDLKQFGVIKSQIYFLPAVSYLVAVPLLQKLNRDVEVCVWCYFVRCLVPIALPFMFLAGASSQLMLWVTSIVFAVSFSCAMFANNTLLKVMRGAFDGGKLNRYALFITLIPNVPVGLLCILVSWWLYRVGGETRNFMQWLAGAQIVTLLFEFPAISQLRKVKMIAPPVRHKLDWKKLQISVRRSFGLLLFTLCDGIWLGLLTTYFVVYLLKEVGLNGSVILWIELGLGLCTSVAASWFGRLADRCGYAGFFTLSALVMLLVHALWDWVPGSVLALILLIVVIYNGNNSGVVASMVRQTISVAAARLAEEGTEEYVIGISSFLVSLGAFFGCLLAGKLFTVAGGNLVTYFRYCSLGTAVLLLLAGLWLYHDKKQRIFK